MSKSLGNSLTIRDALRQMDYTVLRFLFLSYHYRQPIELSEEAIERARKGCTGGADPVVACVRCSTK